jgi:hypothetical protein
MLPLRDSITISKQRLMQIKSCKATEKLYLKQKYLLAVKG